MVGSFYFLIKYYARLTEDQKKTYNARQALYMKEKRAKKADLQAVIKAMEEAESEEMLSNKHAAASLRQRKCRERVVVVSGQIETLVM